MRLTTLLLLAMLLLDRPLDASLLYVVAAPHSVAGPKEVRPESCGAVGDGSTDDTKAITKCIMNSASVRFSAKTYLVSDTISIPSTGNGKKITFSRGTRIISTAKDPVRPVFSFANTGDGLTIAGNGAHIGYATAPKVRSEHVVSVTGATLTNLTISGLNIDNGGNMGIAIYCGRRGGVASGSRGIKIDDCTIKNTLGDGVHVENADSGVVIDRIRTDHVHDDAVAVINYTGTSGAPTHPTPTSNVRITNITANNNYTAAVSLAGVKDFTVSNVVETGMANHSTFTLKMTHAAGYTVGNSNGTIDNVRTTGAAKIIVLDTPGNGTSYNRSIRIGKIAGSLASGTAAGHTQAISLSNSGTATDGRLQDIEIGDLEVTGSGGAHTDIGLISQTRNVRIGRVRADSFSGPLQASNNLDFSWRSVEAHGFVPGTTHAMVVSDNTGVRGGAVDIDARNSWTGLLFQSNRGAKVEGPWSVSNALRSNIIRK